MKSTRLRALRSVLALPLIALTLTSVPSFEGRGMADTFRAGITTLVSTYSDGSPADGGAPSVSSDGRYVAFDSWDRLSPLDTDDEIDVYRKDMQTGETVLVSVEVAGVIAGPYNSKPSISGDGSKVAYLSGWCYFHLLVSELPSCPGGVAHVRNVASDATVVTSDLTMSARGNWISRGGRYVVVLHEGDGFFRLDTADTGNGSRSFVTGLCTDCSPNGPQQAAISATGRYVAFESLRPHVASDTDGNWDVYIYDRDTDANGIFDETGKTAFQIVGIRPNGDSAAARWPAIADDGQTVAFMGGDIEFMYVYVRDLRSSSSTIVSQNSLPLPSELGILLSISGDGGKVAYEARDSHLPQVDTNPGMDVYLRDRPTNKTVLGSILPDGNQGVGDRFWPSLSGDGRNLAFQTSLLVVAWDGLRSGRRVYLRDLTTPCPVVCLEPSVAPPNEPTPEAAVVDSRNPSGALTALPTVNGHPYRLSARGVYQYGVTWATALADANCASLDGVNFYSNLYPSLAAGILKLQVNGQVVSWVPHPGTEAASDPACSTEHHYFLDVTGDGNLVRFAISDTNHSDNLGALPVTLVPSSS